METRIAGADWFLDLVDALQWKMQGLRAIGSLLARASPSELPEGDGLAILLDDWADQVESLIETGWRVGKPAIYGEGEA